MELNATEKKKGKYTVEVAGEGHTLLNLLRDSAWETGADQASYMIEHPYMSTPKIIVKGKNPKKILKDSATVVSDQAKEFEKRFKRAMKK